MRRFWHILSSEFLKLKRTPAVTLAIVVPLILVMLVFGIALQRGGKILHEVNPVAGLSQQLLTLWTILLFPFVGALLPALLGSLEYQDENWKQVLSWPVSKFGIYAAKWLIAYGLLCVSAIVLWLGDLGMGELLRFFKPDWRAAELPWLLLTKGVVLSLLASTLFLSIQMWISLRWRNFIFGIAAGVFALVVNIIILPSGMVAGEVFPWSLPAMAMAPVSPHRTVVVLWGVAGGVASAAFACWRLSIRECP